MHSGNTGFLLNNIPTDFVYCDGITTYLAETECHIFNVLNCLRKNEMAHLCKCTQTIWFHNYRNCRIIASVNSHKIEFQKVSKVTGNTGYIQGTTLHNQVQPLPDLQPSDVMTKIPKFPYQDFNSNSLKFHFTQHFELCTLSYRNAHYWNNRMNTFSLLDCWRVYVGYHFIFSIYNKVFRTYPVRKSSSTFSIFH